MFEVSTATVYKNFKIVLTKNLKDVISIEFILAIWKKNLI